MNQYIIDEELVEAVETALKSDEHCKKCPYEGGGFKQGVTSHLRSHPYNPQAEREKVLDKVLQLPQRREKPNGSMYIYVNDVKKLRQSKDGE
jgi:hypothetical protein